MIGIKNLSKYYGKVAALNDVSINIKPQSMVYVVGPNGSGKTTLIKSILGIIKPSAGTITFDRERLNGTSRYRKGIGYMPQVASFPENLKVSEVLNMIKEIRGGEDKLDEELISEFGLIKEFDKKIKSLSGGTKQKLSAAIAFLFSPKMLILDEPTAGLDPVSSSKLKDKIIKERESGKTVLFTSHILGELEELSEEIIFLFEGSMSYFGDKNNLVNSTGERNLERAIAKIMLGSKQ